jgi:ribosomal subunit interface protein
MQIIISARHVSIADNLRQHVEEQFERLARFDGRISRLEVTLTEEKNRCVAEANLSVDREAPVHGRAEAADFRSAIDRLADKMSRQLKKRRSRRRVHKAGGPDQMVAAEEPEA